jgi:crossover junction endodeoxyribonuclease RuvC
MRILGIDPGMADIGFGVIERAGRGWRAVECGTIKTRKEQLAQERLAEIDLDLRQILAQHQPNYAVVEAFVPHTAKHGAIDVLQARGVILLALERVGLGCAEPHQQTWKAAILSGRAEKHEIIAHVRDELGMQDDPPSNHAADALGMALYYARFVA